MKRAIIYTRFSPQRHAEESASCETQYAYCEQYCHQKGYEIAGSKEDRAASGSDEERPGMWEAIGKLGKGDVLLVWKLDRLARNVYLMELIRRGCEAVGATIEAVQGDVEGNGPEQVMIRQVLSAISEYERKVIALRTKYAMLHHQKTGLRMSRHPPYGWTLDPNDPARMIPNASEGAAVLEILRLRKEGSATCEIVRTMNQFWKDVSRSKRWTPKTIDTIIKRG